VFCQHLPFLCFFCSMLICQPLIGGQKGLGFCHHRIEVILKALKVDLKRWNKRVFGNVESLKKAH
jgi:hypothetical protein